MVQYVCNCLYSGCFCVCFCCVRVCSMCVQMYRCTYICTVYLLPSFTAADKFSEIFLGEFDTPEAIWSSEMRRMMIEKIAGHIADFTPRLLSNTKSLYQYCAIPLINYPQLENELFCNIYYLRHLCDTQRFPDWPIKEPVSEVCIIAQFTYPRPQHAIC